MSRRKESKKPIEACAGSHYYFASFSPFYILFLRFKRVEARENRKDCTQRFVCSVDIKVTKQGMGGNLIKRCGCSFGTPAFCSSEQLVPVYTLLRQHGHDVSVRREELGCS